MKRCRKVLWLILILLGLSLLCWAGNDTQIPAGHWAYSAMSRLMLGEMIEGFPNINRGELLTRLEVAFYLKKFLLKLDEDKEKYRLTREQAQLLDRLILEFRPELTMLGVKITDLTEITPSIRLEAKSESGYSDLDLVMTGQIGEQVSDVLSPDFMVLNEPCYFVGSYFTTDFAEKSFYFLPESFIQPSLDRSVLSERWDIVHTLDGKLDQCFLAVKGDLPVKPQNIKGLYLFPLESRDVHRDPSRELTAYNLLEQLSHGYRVNNLRQKKGFFPITNLSTLDELTSSTPFQIGNYLISTDFDEVPGPQIQPIPSTTPAFQDLDLLLLPANRTDDGLNLKIDLKNQERWVNPVNKQPFQQDNDLWNSWSQDDLTSSIDTRWSPPSWGETSTLYWDSWSDRMSWLMMQMELLTQPDNNQTGITLQF